MKTAVLILVLLLGTAALLPPTCSATPGDVLSSWATPDEHPTGLTNDGQRLWVADRFTDTLYALDPGTGEVLTSLQAPGFIPRGLAWDGQALWCVDGQENRIIRLDVTTGLTLASLDCPTPRPQGLAWDGQYLWLADEQKDRLSKISTEDGTMVVSFPAPSGAPQGLTWDGRYLWCADRGRDRIYMIAPERGEVLLSLAAPGEHARGLTWLDGRLWCVDYQDDTISQLVVDDGITVKISEPRRERLRFMHEFRNYGPGSLANLDVYLALPGERANQKLLSEVLLDPAPTSTVTDRWGQRFAHYHAEDLPLAQRHLVTMAVDVELADARWFVFPDKVGALKDIPREIRKLYLVDEDKYRIDDPVIQKAVAKAVGEEQNPYWIMQKIYRYLHKELEYELSGGWNVAPAILTRGNGSCSEYSFVFIAMCRAAGLPARYVGSVVTRGDDASTDDVFHRWCECYLPGLGWVPVDPSGGDQDKPADVAEYFGHLRNRFLITTEGGGASEYLGWNYNSHEVWKARGPVKVNVEVYGEWSPLPDSDQESDPQARRQSPVNSGQNCQTD